MRPGGVHFAKNFWNEDWSMITLPTACNLLRPSFCLSNSFRRRVISLACSLASTSFRNGLIVSRAMIRLPTAA